MACRVPAVLLAIPLAAVAACSRPPVEFRHAAHVTVTKGACAPCHGSDPAAPRRAADADCAACHRQARERFPPGAGPYGVGGRGPASAGSSVQAVAAFPHAQHAAAGVACAACHAPSRWRVNRFIPPPAEECSACHSRMR